MAQNTSGLTEQGLVEILNYMGNLEENLSAVREEKDRLLVGLIICSFAWTACDLTQTHE